MKIKDRIKELRRVKAKDLIPNSKNWRVHPKTQAAALRGLLSEIGYADALLARELPDGRLQLIDGHLRAETTPNATVPVLILDVTDSEADKILLTLDPLAAMAEADTERTEEMAHRNRPTMAAWRASPVMRRFNQGRGCCAADERRAGRSVCDGSPLRGRIHGRLASAKLGKQGLSKPK